ncbi:MAG TPA: signal peptide peptidase SppA [Bacillota bacterium]|nr:signal peptide peptidase SppA [Bacillota bacterium]HUM56441.1 signal peptide peptidase SppA [Bacillota bacterium]
MDKKSKMKKPLIILGSILGGLIVLGLIFAAIGGNPVNRAAGLFGADMSGGSQQTDYSYVSEDHIAVIHVDGIIGADTSGSFLSEPLGYDHQFTMDSIDEAIENEDNKGLIVFVDSPGGSVYETDELYMKIKEYKKKTERPVYAYMGSMAASGGYYLSAPADKIFASRNCWTGSIGVTVGTFYDISGLLEKYGIRTVTIDSGNNKSMGSMTEPMSSEEKEIWQRLVDEAYEQFVDIVADGRGMSIDNVKKLADGRIYSASQAKKNGLIDEIGTFDDAANDMKKQNDLGPCEIYEVYPPEESLIDQLFMKISESKESGSDIERLLGIINENGNYPVAYICEKLK